MKSKKRKLGRKCRLKSGFLLSFGDEECYDERKPYRRYETANQENKTVRYKMKSKKRKFGRKCRLIIDKIILLVLHLVLSAIWFVFLPAAMLKAALLYIKASRNWHNKSAAKVLASMKMARYRQILTGLWR